MGSASWAAQPVDEGVVVRDGVRLAYTVFGVPDGPTVLLLPTWSILPSRFWKAQTSHDPNLSRGNRRRHLGAS